MWKHEGVNEILLETEKVTGTQYLDKTKPKFLILKSQAHGSAQYWTSVWAMSKPLILLSEIYRGYLTKWIEGRSIIRMGGESKWLRTVLHDRFLISGI